MFVVLEGIDGAGKTTATELVAKNLGFAAYATPPEEFKKRREKIDEFGSPEEKFKFFLDGVRQASDEIWDMIASGQSVICDRYWMTTLIYHKIIGVDVDEKVFDTLLAPDLTVLLLVSADEQMKRLVRRGFSINDRQMVGRQAQLSQEYKRLCASGKFPSKVINTDHLAPAEVSGAIIDMINAIQTS